MEDSRDREFETVRIWGLPERLIRSLPTSRRVEECGGTVNRHDGAPRPSCLVILGRASPGFLGKRLKADDPQFGHIAVEHFLEFVPFRDKAVHPWLAAAIDLAGELVEIRADLVDGARQQSQGGPQPRDGFQVNPRGAGAAAEDRRFA